MRVRELRPVVLPLAFIGVTLGAQQPPWAPPRPDSAALPGLTVDVRAGEFFFQAPDTIPAGLTTFRLHQTGILAERHAAGMQGQALVADKGDNTRGFHMLWVVRLDSGKTMADLYRATQAGDVPTPWAKHLGGPGLALPPRTTNATLSLTPGNYVLVCFVGSARADRTRYHFLNGMSRAFTVVATSRPATAAPRADVVARIVGQGVVEFSAPIRAGRQVIRVDNASDRRKEFKFARMRTGVTGKDFLAQVDSSPAIGWGGLSDVPAGGSVTTTIDFEPGEYVVGTGQNFRSPTSRVVIVAARR